VLHRPGRGVLRWCHWCLSVCVWVGYTCDIIGDGRVNDSGFHGRRSKTMELKAWWAWPLAVDGATDARPPPAQAIASIVLLCILVVFIGVDFRPSLGPATPDILGMGSCNVAPRAWSLQSSMYSPFLNKRVIAIA
jgi:hypothetical protein